MHVAPKAVQDSRSRTQRSAKFPATRRLLRENGFDHVIHAENIADRCFKIFFVRNNGKNARLGIIASKKILPHAVNRNRAKRIIRETFRQHNINIRKLDVVVLVRRAYAQQTMAQCGSLEKLFSWVNNRCAES